MTISVPRLPVKMPALESSPLLKTSSKKAMCSPPGWLPPLEYSPFYLKRHPFLSCCQFYSPGLKAKAVNQE